jgi:hypothetical protein
VGEGFTAKFAKFTVGVTGSHPDSKFRELSGELLFASQRLYRIFQCSLHTLVAHGEERDG